MSKRITLISLIMFAIYLVLFYTDLVIFASFYNELINFSSKIIIYITFILPTFIVGAGYKIIKNDSLSKLQTIAAIFLYSLLFFCFINFMPPSFDIMVSKWHIYDAIKEIPRILFFSLIGFYGFYFGNRIQFPKVIKIFKINKILIIPLIMWLLHSIFIIISITIFSKLYESDLVASSINWLFPIILILPVILISNVQIFYNYLTKKCFISVLYIVFCIFPYLLLTNFKVKFELLFLLALLSIIIVYFLIGQIFLIRKIFVISNEKYKSKYKSVNLNFILIFIAYILTLIPIYLINQGIINILPVNILLSILPLVIVWGALRLIYKEVEADNPFESIDEAN